MLTSITKIDFNDYTEAIPCFIAIIAMPFMYSISEGIAMGVISYVAVSYTHLDVYKRQFPASAVSDSTGTSGAAYLSG